MKSDQPETYVVIHTSSFSTQLNCLASMSQWSNSSHIYYHALDKISWSHHNNLSEDIFTLNELLSVIFSARRTGISRRLFSLYISSIAQHYSNWLEERPIWGAIQLKSTDVTVHSRKAHIVKYNITVTGQNYLLVTLEFSHLAQPIREHVQLF
jgi:hypothetical protein